MYNQVTMQKRGFIGPAVVILVAILSIAGLIGLGMYIGKKSSGSTATNPVVTASPTVSVDPATANWKTYTNTADNYTIKYLSSWNFVELMGTNGHKRVAFGQGVTNTSEDRNTRLWIIIQIPGENGSIVKSARDFLQSSLSGDKSSPSFQSGQINNVTIGGVQGYKLTDSFKDNLGTVRTNVVIAVDNNNLIYEFGGGSYIFGESNTSEFNQMISTFKFTN